MQLSQQTKLSQDVCRYGCWSFLLHFFSWHCNLILVHSVFTLLCSLKSTQGEWGLLRIKPRIPVVLYSSFMWWCIFAIYFTSLTLRTRCCMLMVWLFLHFEKKMIFFFPNYYIFCIFRCFNVKNNFLKIKNIILIYF